MNARKQRDKNRRRARRWADEAWKAADAEDYTLAVKIIRRAVELQPANPLLWNDLGLLLLQINADEQAAAAFESAILVTHDFAEAYASLAAIRARQGKPEQAVALQREAVRSAPASDRLRQALAAYEALLAGGCSANTRLPLPLASEPHGDRRKPALIGNLPDLARRIDNLNWPEIDDRLTKHGLAHVPTLLTADQCETLRAMFDDDRRFAKTVTMNKSRFGKGVYRYFAAPLPELVDAVRRLVYPHVAEVANRWQFLLRSDERYPPAWPEFERRCAAAGQTTPSPLLLRYEAGGFNAPHQDLRGEVYFPLQLVVVLSARADSETNDPHAFTGGEFLFCDQPERKAADRCVIPAGMGDAVLFCTRERLVRVRDVYGLQPVKHGLERITSGTRYAIGIPFHDFK